MPGGPLHTTREVAQLTGISAATLRKWEERYGLVTPTRLPNGYRGYTDGDVALLRWANSRVQAGALISMVAEEARDRLAAGWNPVAEGPAAPTSPSPDRVAPAPGPAATATVPEGLAALRDRLVHQLTVVDETVARRTLDEAFALYPVETVLTGVVEPVLHQIGRLWQTGAISEFQEHFASVVIRDRLSSLRALLPPGAGPHVITACVPGDLHEIGALVVSLLALRRGFRVTHLSGSPSPDGLCRAVESLKPHAVLLSATTPEALEAATPHLAALAAAAAGALQPRLAVYVGGQGVRQAQVLPDIPGVTFSPFPAEEVLREIASTHRCYNGVI